MTKSNHHKPETIAARANGALDLTSGGIVPSLQSSTTFVRDQNNELVNTSNVYGRDDNDNVRLAQSVLNALEQARDTLLFPSGMAAIATLVRQLVAGDTLILQSGIYWGTSQWIRDFCGRHEIKLVELDCSNTTETIDAINAHKPQMVFVETPSNPWLKIVDIRALSQCCKSVGGCKLVVDSTAATPCLSQPLSMGADLVVHSATKAINGHSDVLAGFVSTNSPNDALWENIVRERHDGGAIIGSFEAWMLVRGMRTLPLRMERMCENALAIADFLDGHQNIEQVLYPGLKEHRDHQLACEQMQGRFGYLMSFLVRGNKTQTLKVCGGLNIIHRATSLGGVESLVEHRQTIEGDDSDIPGNLLRLSVGIEHIDDLIGDLDQALNLI